MGAAKDDEQYRNGSRISFQPSRVVQKEHQNSRFENRRVVFHKVTGYSRISTAWLSNCGDDNYDNERLSLRHGQRRRNGLDTAETNPQLCEF